MHRTKRRTPAFNRAPARGNALETPKKFTKSMDIELL
jgi:hypothetical protein